MESTKKSIPKSILIFGAAGHIGQPLAEFLTREAPDIEISLVARSPEKQKMLQDKFPKARVLAADYEDPSSLAAAVKGVEGVFVISSSGMSETTAMTNLTNVLKQEGSAVHVIRLLGIFPEFNPRRVPANLGPGSLPYEHPIAKRILDESDLPVTYINSGATFIDNLWLQIQPVLLHKKFIWPEHRVPFLDPRDVAEVAGRLFLSDNAKHVGAFHTMNNGHDWLCFEEVAGILGDELGESLAFDGSYEGFMEFWGPRMGKKAERIWNFFKFEQANEEQWALNNFVERILGRKPTTVRGWIVEHKDALVKGDRTVSWA
ncbi:uncharacterized protein FSUBG_8430 [Fusarium subglutinans]|uniref:NAD(P)-binding domain-containing protein n=1 Tax=Gibberella subglutinans TaxID=42677 RepID=A0A8H5PJD5_GIBSU|nr:uncharacterized protein FSUBG_8430 [Fusarium subglutinans]KAF5597598.1 hypothetical protein FSUBG_8430 [Fusarium subglutinans]